MNIKHLLIAAFMELRRIYHDKRRMLILIIGPVTICLIFGYVFFHPPEDVDITVFVDQFYNSSAVEYSETTQIIDAIESSDTFSVVRVFSMDNAFTRLSNGDSRAVVILQEGVDRLESIKITIDVTDSIIQQIIFTELPQIIEAYTQQYAVEFLSNDGIPAQQASRIVQFFGVDITTNEWKNIEYFDFGASGVIVLFVMGICLLISATAVTSERTSGTIERIFASPYKGSEIILSKMLAYTLIAIIVAALVVVTLKLMFGIVLGNVFLVFLVAILIGINAIVLGLLVSAVTYTELESVLGGVVFWFLAQILMGFTWPLETMHPVFTWVSKINPYSYGLHAMRHVNLTNWGLDQIWFDLVVLLGFIVVQALLAIQFLRREIG